MPADRPGDFGSTLRAARERKGVSLREIAARTKISVAVLEALERNDIKRLPGGIFSRAFVRSYAAEVGLDPEQTVHDFIAQFPHDSVTAGHSTSDRSEDNEGFESERQMASTVLWMVIVSIPLAAGVVYFSMTSRRGAEPVDVVPGPATVAAPASTTSTPPVRQPDPAAAVAEPPAVPAPPAADKAVPTALEKPAPPPAASDRLTIGLAARRPVFVQVTVDGQKTIDRLLRAGEKQTAEVSRELVLTAGDASAITLTLNGAEARPLGKSGEVVRARLTPANFKEYLQAR